MNKKRWKNEKGFVCGRRSDVGVGRVIDVNFDSSIATLSSNVFERFKTRLLECDAGVRETDVFNFHVRGQAPRFFLLRGRAPVD